MVFFTKTCTKDLQWLTLSIKTVEHYAQEPIDWYIVGDNDTMVELVALSKLHTRNITWHLCSVQDRWPELMSMAGYHQQQGVKLLAHRFVPPGYFLVVDSDLLFQGKFTAQSFKGTSLPIYWVSDFNHVAGTDPVNQSVHWARRDLLTNMLGRADVNLETMRCLPIWLNTDVLKALEASNVWNTAFDKLMAADTAFSEFNLYGSYAYFYFHHLHEWRNAELEAPTWSGVWGDKRFLVSQGWSWENPSQSLIDAVNAL